MIVGGLRFVIMGSVRRPMVSVMPMVGMLCMFGIMGVPNVAM